MPVLAIKKKKKSIKRPVFVQGDDKCCIYFIHESYFLRSRLLINTFKIMSPVCIYLRKKKMHISKCFVLSEFLF